RHKLNSQQKLASPLPFGNFNRSRVKRLLALYFVGGAMDTRALKSETEVQEMQRKGKYIERLLRLHPPDYVAPALREWKDEIESPLWLQQQRKEKRSGKCPVLSTLVTTLADYLFSVYVLRADCFQSAADCYRLIGDILTPMTSPA